MLAFSFLVLLTIYMRRNKPRQDDPCESIAARFKLAGPQFTLDVDLELPGRGVTALFGPPARARPRCCAASPAWNRRRRGLRFSRAEPGRTTPPFLPTTSPALGYVFQEASLFPHLTARGNLEYGRCAAPPRRTRAGLDQVIELLGIGHLLERQPDQLSGGERQRVGIARALAVRPGLLLMDEPLAALDLKRKQEILPYLERLHDELDIPVLYVSHSPDEVARLADHIVLHGGGRALASGPLTDHAGAARPADPPGRGCRRGH
jgi:molybdate transport system ATP-binding protein